MPFNGSGIFSIINSFTPGTTIASSPMNANFTDIATGLTDCLTRDGQAPMTAPLLLINGSNSVPSLAFAADPTNGIYRSASGSLGVSGNLEVDGTINQASNPLIPAGAMMSYAGSTAPGGWLLCYGQAISRTTYATLFAVIGTTYGVGDGSTTFNLPDLRGRTLAGLDNMGGVSASRLSAVISSSTLGAAGGAQNQTLAQSNLPAATFPISATSSTGISDTHRHGTLAGDQGYAAVSVVSSVNSISINNPGTGTPTTVVSSIGLVTLNNNVSGLETGLTNTGSITASTTTSGSASSGGSGVAVNTTQPTMVANTIIKY